MFMKAMKAPIIPPIMELIPCIVSSDEINTIPNTAAPTSRTILPGLVSNPEIEIDPTRIIVA
jgi:hypothetical protein